MCGIVGVVGPEAASLPDRLAPALSLLTVRGPDDGGRLTVRMGGAPVALGVRRLALIDVARGQMPVMRPSGSVLVLNGEVYNHDALRRDLEARGERFSSRGDAEVLAALLDAEGIDGLAKVEGSYALAFVRAPDGPLWLARDPMGVRPLCWARTAQGLVFASTLDAIVATGLVAPQADLQAVAEVLRDGVVLGAHSALKGVARLLPGEVLRVGTGGEVVSDRVPPPPLEPADAQGEPATAVLDALRVAVLDRLRAERPCAVFLSGGVDSAIVASFSREAGRVPAYTLTFPRHPVADEGPRARRTAQRLGLEQVEVPLPDDPTPWVLGVARHFDEPFGDASAVPTWGLARAAGAAARVALTGTGGDEVFGGYRRYWLLGAGPWLHRVPRLVREPIAYVLDRASPPGARLLRAAADPEGLYRGLLRLQPHEDFVRLAGPAWREAAAREPAPGPATAGEAMADDLHRYLPWDLLVKEDRALMAHGVEGRHPFLDRRVAAAAARLEVVGHPGRGRQKQVLRAYVREVVDPDLAEVAKHGFALPVDALYTGPLYGLAEDALLSRRALERGWTDPEQARRLLREHVTGERSRGPVIHALVMLELWARRVLDRTPTLA